MSTFYHSPDWQTWQPDQRATLLFLKQDSELLLIRKKRGLGAGKVTAPGGKLEANETPLACALRETQEEVGLQATQGCQVARLKFQFTDGYALQVEAFFSQRFEGTLVETDEALPFWASLDAIPYDQMWADDILWLPRVLAGQKLCGHFVFEKDRMLYQDIHEVDENHWAQPLAF